MNPTLRYRLAVATRWIRRLPRTLRQLRPVNLLLICFAALTILTWIVGDAEWQYSSGKELSFESHFPGERSDWNLSGETGSLKHDGRSILLAASGSEEQSRARKRFELPATRKSWQRSLPDRIYRRVFGNDRLLRVRSVVETLQAPGQLSGRARHARVAAWLIDTDETDKPFRYATIAKLNGSLSRYQIDKVQPVPARTDAVELVFMSLESDGHFRMRHLEARLVERTLLYRIILAVGIVAWLAFAIALARGVIKRVGLALTAVMALSLSAIIIGVMLPETVRFEPVRRLFAALTASADDASVTSFTLVYKAGHFVFFTLATLIVLLNRWRLGLRSWQVFIFFVLLAIATEGFQLHLFDRTTLGTDMLVDTAGVGLAFLLALALVHFGIQGRRRERHSHVPLVDGDEAGDANEAAGESTDCNETVEIKDATEADSMKTPDALNSPTDEITAIADDNATDTEVAEPDSPLNPADTEAHAEQPDESNTKGTRRRRKKRRSRRFKY